MYEPLVLAKTYNAVFRQELGKKPLNDLFICISEKFLNKFKKGYIGRWLNDISASELILRLNQFFRARIP